MSDFTTKATVLISVNGQQAKSMLSSLRSDAETLKSKIEDANKAGDKLTMQKLQKELNKTNKLIDQLDGSTQKVRLSMQALDKATPKELQRELKQLQAELNHIERGSKAWDEHISKIQQVKSAIADLNEQMKPDKPTSFVDKINDAWNRFQVVATGAAAAVTGLVVIGRKAVDAYAEMEQEEANVRKFTGFTAEQVAQLNDEFKKMDTRTSRQELNKLAQDAGRLGKSSVEDVLGFVRAADKINVALDDLGDGATLTLSKLNGVFGIEKELGTERALLATGSVINELSQNCAASAPAITDFTARLGGIGAQAGLTIPQIMAYASVLDASGVSVEKSATAMQALVSKLLQEPAKYAKAAGLEVQAFSDLLKTDVNAAMIEFLEALNRAGGLDKLAPMFADMKEKGSGMVQTLATLAQQIGMVKSQQEAANVAFNEATSIGSEFDVQNNTVAATLDKAKKKFQELVVELGQKLLPVMRYVKSTTSLLTRAISGIVDFIIAHWRVIVSVTAAIAAYNIALKASIALEKIQAALTSTNMALSKGMIVLFRTKTAVVEAVKLAFFKLTRQTDAATAAQIKLGVAVRSTPWGAILSAVAAAAAAFMAFGKNSKDAADGVNELRRAKIKSMATYVEETALLQENIRRIEKYKDTLRDNSDIVDQLNDKYGPILGTYSSLAEWYDVLKTKGGEYIQTLQNQIIAEGKMAQARRLMEMAGELRADNSNDDIGSYWDVITGWLDHQGNELFSFIIGNDTDFKSYDTYSKELWAQARKQRLAKADEYEKQAVDLIGNALKNTDNNQTNIDGVVTPSNNGHSQSQTVSSTGSEKTDKLKEEKAKRDALLMVENTFFNLGLKNQIDHNKAVDAINVQYFKDVLSREDLTNDERLKIMEEYSELSKSQRERDYSQSLADEENKYNVELAIAKQAYIDGTYSRETYEDEIERIEIEHQKRLVEIQKDGSKERSAANARLQDLLLKQVQRRQTEAEKLESKKSKVKESVFGLNQTEKDNKYAAELAILQAVYANELQMAGDNASEKLRIEKAYLAELKRLRKEYSQPEESPDSLVSRWQNANNKVVEWLNSDGGKAVTGSLSTISSGLSDIFSAATQAIQADLEIQTAAINRRYDAEIQAAEGNTYKVKALEKKKEKETAKIKADANKKMFAMQVIQAVAQTAQSAINAYSSAAAIPVVGFVMAPIAAAMAVAAGMMQIANIKKQQQASAAQGYSSGGFTKPGRKDEPAGIVHAGEWVASQSLVNNARVRPLLEALDYAQRTNTIGAITDADVSRSITAPMVLASQAVNPVVVQSQPQTVVVEQNAEFAATMRRLSQRLDEPFVTVATATGDYGINKAISDYERLIKNKSPKSASK